MRSSLRSIYLGVSALAVATALVGVSPSIPAFAQTTSAASAVAALPESVIKALQEALNKQGIALPVTGVLSEETRAAIRKYQGQHHLPVTGEADKATLDKLGVRVAAAPGQAQTVGQATQPAPGTSTPGQAAAQRSQTQAGMNCPMLQGQMQGMMQMMGGMMQMMPMMQAQMQPGQMQPQQPGQAQPGQMQPGRMPQGQMQPGQMPQGQMQPGQMQPGQMRGPQGGSMRPQQN